MFLFGINVNKLYFPGFDTTTLDPEYTTTNVSMRSHDDRAPEVLETSGQVLLNILQQGKKTAAKVAEISGIKPKLGKLKMLFPGCPFFSAKDLTSTDSTKEPQVSHPTTMFVDTPETTTNGYYTTKTLDLFFLP